MPRDPVAEHPAGAVLYRYRPVPGAPDIGGAPVLLVPPLGAPDFAYDLRRGCSLVEHLLGGGRVVYLVDYGDITFADRRRGMEHWVDDVVPWAARVTGARVHLVAWSLGGIFALLAVAAAAQAGDRLPVDTVTAIGSPIDISAVPLVAPFRPLAAAPGVADFPCSTTRSALSPGRWSARRSSSRRWTGWSRSRSPCSPGSTTATCWPRSKPSTT